ncbi:MAG: DNA-binding domain-containing protein [Myxococcota bacterium]
MTQLELKHVQRWFLDVCTHPDSIAAGMQQAAAQLTITNEEQLSRLVKPGPRLTSSERLDIYRQSYGARLVECLRDDYPALAYALGDEPFEALARAYIEARPSRSPSLNYFGRGLAEFCAAREGSAQAFVVELARLEWALVEAIHAPANKAISEQQLARIQPEQWQHAIFSPSPALQLFHFAHPINAFYQAFCDEAAPTLPQVEASFVAVYRSGLALWRADLSAPRFHLLQSLTTGTPLGAALERAASEQETNETDVLAWFGEWMRDGFFQGVRVES